MSGGVCPSCGKTYPRSSGHCPNDGTQIVPLAPQAQDAGRVLDQRYEVRDALGTGRIGATYRGWQIHLGREVAIKIIHPSFSNDPAAADRFVDAARAACQLVAPSVCNVYDVGRTKDAVLYVVSELVRGQSLAERKQRALSVPRVVAIAMQVCDALDAAHRSGIVHGDLKASNVLVDDANNVKVLDFGFAHAFAKGGVDTRTDLHAFGVLLFELLAGEPRAPALPPNVPAPLAAVVQKLLARSIASCKELRAQLLPIQAHVGVPARAPGRMSTPPGGAPFARDPTTPPSVPPSAPPSTPPSVPPTAVVPPLPLQPVRAGSSRIVVIVLVAIVVSGGAIAALFAAGVL